MIMVFGPVIKKSATFNAAPARRAVAFLLPVFMLLLLSSPARGDFEAYNLFGAGAVSNSDGGSAVGSDRDTLDFLVNPALIMRYDTTRYSLGYMDYGDKFQLRDYKQIILSYAKGKKGYSLILDEDGGIDRDMFIFTTKMPYGSGKKYMFGVNVGAYRYSTPAVELTKTNNETWVYPSDDGSGFTLDVGVFRAFDNGVEAAFAINNLLSTASSAADSGTSAAAREELKLPRVYNFGIRYPVKENFDLLMSYKYYSVDADKDTVNITGEDDNNGSFIFIGGEYKLDNPLSARGGYIRDSEFYPTSTDHLPDGVNAFPASGRDDQSAAMGISYLTDHYNVGVTTLGYHDTFDSANSLLVSYKGSAEEPWKAPLSPEPKAETKTAERPDRKPEVKYEEPLPSIEPVNDEEPEETTQAEKPGDQKKNTGFEIEYDDDYDRPVDEDEPVRPKTKVASFSVEPKVMIIPQASVETVKSATGHWAEKYVDAMAQDGFYSRKNIESFSPSQPVPREEFYRLVFLTQVTRVFDSPIVVLFNTPYPVSAEMWFSAPSMSEDVLMKEGTYDRAGQKRLVINRGLLDEKEIFAGKYKLRLRIMGENMRPEELEEYITILDTSMDFSSLEKLPADKKEKQIDVLKRSMENMGINVDYLDGLRDNGPITRLEALKSLYAAVGVKLPQEFNTEGLFADIKDLPEEDRAAIFLASRGMNSLGGFALMNGYPDGTFQPTKPVIGAEAAALVDRFRKLLPTDFEPPFKVAAKPTPYVAPKGTGEKAAEDGSVQKMPGLEIGAEEYGDQPSALTKLISDLPAPSANAKFFISAGSYMSQENVDRAVAMLVNRGYTPEIFTERIGTVVAHHIIVGRFDKEADARAALLKLRPVPELDFKVIAMFGGTATTTLPQTQASSRPLPTVKKDRQAEGTMHLEGSSFVPWNLIRNLGDFEPHSAESPAEIIE